MMPFRFLKGHGSRAVSEGSVPALAAGRLEWNEKVSSRNVPQGLSPDA